MQSRKSHWGRACCTFVAVMLAVLVALPVAQARELLDTSKDTSLTIEYTHGGVPLKEVRFALYYVAEISAYAEYTIVAPFDEYGVSLECEDNAAWQATATALAGYIQRDNLEPLRVGTTNEEGVWQSNWLKPGLYLVMGEPKTIDGYKYSCESYFVNLPGLDKADAWVYDVKSNPKVEKEIIPPEPIERKVLKVWDDNKDSENKRPVSIEIQLLQDGVAVDTVTLNQQNNWRYTWSKLAPEYTWSVVEKSVPAGYSVSQTQDGTTFVVTNTRKTTVNPTPKPSGNLPQTGMLWWPIPVLALGGVALFAVGWLRSRNTGEADD